MPKAPLTVTDGLGRVPLAHLVAVGGVAADEEEAGQAAVAEHGALHRGPQGPVGHAAVLQGRPHARTQQHWRGKEDSVSLDMALTRFP